MSASQSTPRARTTVTDLARHPRSFEELRVWQAGHVEDVLDPSQPIVDPHHHLWVRPGQHFLLEEFLAEADCGHDLRATVYVECSAMYRASGPLELRPVGETEFANGMAAMSASGQFGRPVVGAGIVGYADLMLGDAVQDVLDAHGVAGGGRLCGIRYQSARDETLPWEAARPRGLLAEPAFRKGYARLAPLRLAFDAWLFFHQIGELTDLARQFPGTPVVLNHVGGILGVGPYEGRREQVFATWCDLMRELAACPNAYVKFGGLGMPRVGLEYALRDEAPSSEVLAAAWRRYFEVCMELFGAQRCMFESNFPPDRQSCSYRTLWNAFKRLAAGCSATEKAALFHGAATRAYHLPAIG